MTRRFEPPPVEHPTVELTIHLTAAEMEMLQWLARASVARELTPAKLVEDFVADLTGSWRTGGSDERERAFDWYKRRGYPEDWPPQHEARVWREDGS